MVRAFASFFLFVFCGRRRSSWGLRWLSVYRSHLSCCLYFVFKDVTTVVWSCWSFDVPPIERCVPSNLCPTHEVVVELNWVVLRWSSWDVDKVPGASSDGSPPCFFKVYEGYVSFPSFFE